MAGNTAAKRALTPSAALRVDGMILTQDGRQLSDPLSFTLRSSSITCLTGPSGVGKSTLLHRVADAVRHDCGTVSLEMPATIGERAVALMSQRETLLPWLTATANIAIVRRLCKVDATVSVAALLDFVELTPLADRYPDELSGGEKQRLVLARTLALETPVLLLDEPFGKLDPVLRKRLILRLREWVSVRRGTALVVSHQLDDVALLADRVFELQGFPARLAER